MQLDPKKTFKVFSGYGVFMNDVWAEAVAEAQPLGLTEQQLLVKLKSRWDQMTGAQKQIYQHRVELSAPCMAVVSGGPKTVEPMEVPYTETLPDEEEGSDDSDYEEVRPVPRLDREGPLRDAWGKLQHGGYLGRTRRDMDPTEAEMLAWTRQAEQRSAEE